MLNKNDIIIIILVLLGLLDFQKKTRSLCTIQGKYREMDASGRVFVPLCFPCMSAGPVLSSLLWRPDLQMSRGFWQKSSVFFIFFSLPKVSSWKLMPQPGKAKHMEVSHFADRKHSGDQRSSTRLGRKPELQPTFPDLWGSAKPT